jgi:hypothetical protein
LWFNFRIARDPPGIVSVFRKRSYINIEHRLCYLDRGFGGRRLQDQVPALLRDQLADIIAGGVFLFIGLASCSVAAIRRQSRVRLFIWFGIWSGMYGAGLLSGSRAIVASLPHWMWISVPYVNTGIAYLGVVVALLAFRELSLGCYRLLIEILIFGAIVVALAGIGWFLFGRADDKFIPYTHLVAVCGLLVLVTVVAVRSCLTSS